MVQLLLEFGADMKRKDLLHRTPLDICSDAAAAAAAAGATAAALEESEMCAAVSQILSTANGTWHRVKD